MPFSEEEKKYLHEFGSIVGIDEAGRGPLAGPLIIAAVLINQDQTIQLQKLGVNDSKKICENKRNKIFDFIIDPENNIPHFVERVEVEEIDEVGIYKITQTGMVRLRQQIQSTVMTIVDGVFNTTFPFEPYKAIKKADQKFISVASASVVAKVKRDSIMTKLSRKYPDYCFDQHKGYGTKLHFQKINNHGPCQIHRKSFSPIKDYFNHTQ